MDLRISVYFHQIVPIWFKIKWYIYSMSITACIHCNTDSWFDVTSVNFNSQNVHEEKNFEWQDILQFLSQGSKYYIYICKIPNHDIATLNKRALFVLSTPITNLYSYIVSKCLIIKHIIILYHTVNIIHIFLFKNIYLHNIIIYYILFIYIHVYIYLYIIYLFGHLVNIYTIYTCIT